MKNRVHELYACIIMEKKNILKWLSPSKDLVFVWIIFLDNSEFTLNFIANINNANV